MIERESERERNTKRCACMFSLSIKPLNIDKVKCPLSKFQLKEDQSLDAINASKIVEMVFV